MLDLIIFVVWLVGALYASVRIRRKAGVMHNRRIDMARDQVGPIWLVKGAVMTVLWPITVVFWAIRALF
jgi:hypothetical protein